MSNGDERDETQDAFELPVCPGCGIVAPAQRSKCESCETSLQQAVRIPVSGDERWAMVWCRFECGHCGRWVGTEGVPSDRKVRCWHCDRLQEIDKEWIERTVRHAHDVADLGSSNQANGDADGTPLSNIGTEKACAKHNLTGRPWSKRPRVAGLRVWAAPGRPLCDGCGAALELVSADGKREAVQCPTCTDRPAQSLHGGLRNRYESAVGDIWVGKLSGHSEATVDEGGSSEGTVALRCAGCSAPLAAEDLSQPVKCEYCGVVSIVPRSVRQGKEGEEVEPEPTWVLLRGPCRLRVKSRNKAAKKARKAAETSRDAAELRSLAEHADPSVRRAVAQNRASPPDVLAQLATDDEDVRLAVASNLDTSAETLQRLARDDADAVREAVADHPDLPDETLTILLNDPKEAVASAARRQQRARKPASAQREPTTAPAHAKVPRKGDDQLPRWQRWLTNSASIVVGFSLYPLGAYLVSGTGCLLLDPSEGTVDEATEYLIAWFLGGGVGALVVIFAANRLVRGARQWLRGEPRPKPEADEGPPFGPKLKHVYMILAAAALIGGGGSWWYYREPDAAVGGSATVTDTKAGTWTFEPQACASADLGSGTVYFQQGKRWVEVTGHEVTVAVTDPDGEVRTARAARADCSRYSHRVARDTVSAGGATGVVREQKRDSVSGETHLDCEMESGGTIRAEIEFDHCGEGELPKPFDPRPAEWRASDVLPEHLVSWNARVDSASGVDVAPGTPCEVTTDMSSLCAVDASVRLLVRCGDERIYLWSTEADGLTDRSCDLYEQGPADPSYGYSLKCRDQGVREGRPQLDLDTPARRARIFHEDGSLDVRLDIEPRSTTEHEDPICRFDTAPPLPTQWVAEVERVRGSLPLEPGQQCDLTVSPSEMDGSPNCKVQLACGDRQLYGAGGGFNQCTVDADGKPLATRDEKASSSDGSPMLELDAEQGTLTFSAAPEGGDGGTAHMKLTEADGPLQSPESAP